MIALCGYLLLIALYKHSILNIFNRRLPTTFRKMIPSLGAHLSLLRPLEIIFRYLTYSWRVLPDIIVLGEVRCGTTSFCEQLASLEGFDCHQPFCLWAHPELDKKETFYFVGHYLGQVTPRHYRMCFPLQITKWWCNFRWNMIRRCSWCKEHKLRRKPFLTFDGCAQYLTSPSAPYLIAQAYFEANVPPPILVACIRDPIDQTISWWKYENNAMAWGESMGLDKWNTELRSIKYPPKNIEEALNLSQHVEDSYLEAETLFSGGVESYGTFAGRKELQTVETYHLPPWAMTWPGGQLSGIGRNGLYASNIERYESIFRATFIDNITKEEGEEIVTESKTKFVNILPLERLSSADSLKKFLISILKENLDRKEGGERLFFRDAIDEFQYSAKGLSHVHRNVGSSKVTSRAMVVDKTMTRLRKHFIQDSIRLYDLCGADYGMKINEPLSLTENTINSD